jgi:heme-degrading monooxygenase HmoA
MNTAIVVEWAPFQIAEGTDETKLLRASEALQSEFLSKQKGFLRRELLHGPGQQWVDLVYWESREAAEVAAQNAANSPVCYT